MAIPKCPACEGDGGKNHRMCEYCNGSGQQPVTPKYKHVNAYACNQEYGGPEEGGWYYETGRLLGSILTLNHPLFIEDSKSALKKAFGWQYEGNRDRHSVIGQDNLEIKVEDEPGADFPEETPHYE